MKNIKRVLSVGFALLLTLCMSVSLSGCILKKYDTYESEYFIYQVSHENGEAYIVGLTDLGKQQEYLIIPETIDGKKLNSISVMTFDVYRTERKYGNLDDINYASENLKKVFIVSGVRIINSWTSYLFSNKEVFYISNADVEFTNQFYRTSLKGETAWHSLTAANVSYDYNYENSSNDGYYWIDNYAYGEKIEYIPEQPIRDGYAFGGWYKESECINAWNFETDTLPQAQYNEQEYEIYQETKLYAKWIKE